MWFLWRVCRKEAGLGRLLSVVGVVAFSTPGSFIRSRVEGLDRVRVDKEEDGRTKAWRMEGLARRRTRERASRREGLIKAVRGMMLRGVWKKQDRAPVLCDLGGAGERGG